MYEELDTYNENSFDLLVSVIITTFNRKHLVGRAIESVLAQTYRKIEIIVVDDCSTDGTVELIKNYNDKVKYIRNKNNVGLSASRNVGIRASSGEYLSFLDDDDELLPEKIALQIDLFLANKDVDVVYCGSIKKNKEFILEKPAKLKGHIFPQVLSSCPNAIHTLLVKRECFDVIGLYDEDLNSHEDHDLWIRLSTNFRFDYVPECLVVYHIHGIQMVTQQMLMSDGLICLLEKHKDLFLKNRNYLYWQQRKLASTYAVHGNYPMFWRHIKKALKSNCFGPGLYGHMFL